MRVLSLFDGMSCGQIALNKAGIPYSEYMASEIDLPAISVAKKNFPSMVHLGDVTRITSKMCGPIDLLMGGSPCQGFSFAGKQLNFEDARSKLFFDFVRLKEELNPMWFLLENVKMKKESEEVISHYLGVRPIEINSKYFTGQNRKRLYWTNIPFPYVPTNRGIDPVKLLGLKEGEFLATVGSSDSRVVRKTRYAGCLTATMGKGVRAAGRPLVTDIEGLHLDLIKDRVRMLSPEECEMLQSVPRGYTSSVPKTHRYKMLGNGWTVDVIAHILQGIELSELLDAL